jgi:hypothetical protein
MRGTDRGEDSGNYYGVSEFSIDRGKEFEVGGIRGGDYIPALKFGH